MPDTLPVSDRAREAAADTYVADHPKREETALTFAIRNGSMDRNSRVQAFANFEREITQSTADHVAELEAALFADDGSDASYNLQGALDDLQGRHKVNDGGVIELTLSRVIDQLERARAALKGSSDGK